MFRSCWLHRDDLPSALLRRSGGWKYWYFEWNVICLVTQSIYQEYPRFSFCFSFCLKMRSTKNKIWKRLSLLLKLIQNVIYSSFYVYVIVAYLSAEWHFVFWKKRLFQSMIKAFFITRYFEKVLKRIFMFSGNSFVFSDVQNIQLRAPICNC